MGVVGLMRMMRRITSMMGMVMRMTRTMGNGMMIMETVSIRMCKWRFLVEEEKGDRRRCRSWRKNRKFSKK